MRHRKYVCAESQSRTGKIALIPILPILSSSAEMGEASWPSPNTMDGMYHPVKIFDNNYLDQCEENDECAPCGDAEPADQE